MRIVFFFLFLLFSFPAFAQEKDPLLGLWITKDQDAIVEFYSCEKNSFCGRFYWLWNEDAKNPSLDDNNKDPALRKRPLCDLTFLGGFTKEEGGLYENGWLYSPRHGSSFNANLHLTGPDTLELRGYVFLPFLGGSQTWHRVNSSQHCRSFEKKSEGK